jgi:transposase
MPDLRTEQELNDRMWRRVRPLLPPRPAHPKGGRPFADDRACFEGIVYLARNGLRWRSMPRCFPSGVTCWRRHRDWAEAGVWPAVWRAILDELRAAGKLDASELALDASLVEAKKGGRRSATRSAARG